MNERSRSFPLTLVVSGFLALAIPAIGLVVLGTMGAVVHARSVAIGLVLVFVSTGVLLGVRFEWRALRRVGEIRRTTPSEIVGSTVAVMSGTIATLVVVIELGLSPVVSAGVVGIVGAIVVPRRAVPVYCGAFVGMTSPELFVTYWHALVAAGVSSVVFVLGKPVFHGVGGKLGTTAFVGATVTVATTAGEFHSEALPGDGTTALIVAVAVLGAMVTFTIHARVVSSPVFASGLVGVVGGISSPIVFGDAGGLVAAAIFAASFAGMTDPKRIPNEGWILLGGAVVGMVFVYTMPYLGGSGGKLGTIAFGSCLAVYGLLGTLHLVRVKRRVRTVPGRDTT